MTVRVFGITGAKGAGKDTLGAAIIAHLGSAVRINFADPLKDACSCVFGLSHDEMNDPVLKETTLSRWPHKSPRQILQLVGTELFREHFPGVWVNAWSRSVAEVSRSVVTTDYRFMDEAAALQKVGAVLIRVSRPTLSKTDTHASESLHDVLPAQITMLNTAESPEAFGAYGVGLLVERGLLPPIKSSAALHMGDPVRHVDGDHGVVLSLSHGLTDTPGAIVKWSMIDEPLWFPLSELEYDGPHLVQAVGT